MSLYWILRLDWFTILSNTTLLLFSKSALAAPCSCACTPLKLQDLCSGGQTGQQRLQQYLLQDVFSQFLTTPYPLLSLSMSLSITLVPFLIKLQINMLHKWSCQVYLAMQLNRYFKFAPCPGASCFVILPNAQMYLIRLDYYMRMLVLCHKRALPH